MTPLSGFRQLERPNSKTLPLELRERSRLVTGGGGISGTERDLVQTAREEGINTDLGTWFRAPCGGLGHAFAAAPSHLDAASPRLLPLGSSTPVGDLTVLDELTRIVPVYNVRGKSTHARAICRTGSCSTSRPPLRIQLTHMAVYEPKLRALVAGVAKAEGARLVVCGHSHVPFIGADRRITMFNPGSVGLRWFMPPIVCIQQVSAATGDGVAQRL